MKAKKSRKDKKPTEAGKGKQEKLTQKTARFVLAVAVILLCGIFVYLYLLFAGQNSNATLKSLHPANLFSTLGIPNFLDASNKDHSEEAEAIRQEIVKLQKTKQELLLQQEELEEHLEKLRERARQLRHSVE